MKRSRNLFFAVLAGLVSITDAADAGPNGNGLFAFLTGQNFSLHLSPGHRAFDARPFIPYAPDPFQREPRFADDPRDHIEYHARPDAPIPFEDRDRAAALDRDLGRALDALRRDLANQADVTPHPRPLLRPDTQTDTIEITRLPDPDAPRTIIEEEEVIGPITLTTASVTPPDVGLATARDVTTHGAKAFSLVENPDALGLAALPDGQQYYRMNGNIVRLDSDALNALTFAALLQVLND